MDFINVEMNMINFRDAENLSLFEYDVWLVWKFDGVLVTLSRNVILITLLVIFLDFFVMLFSEEMEVF